LYNNIIMDTKELVKKFGTAAVNNYVHMECVNVFTKSLPVKDKVIETVWVLKPEELIGKYKDIDRCDSCSKPFILWTQDM
jgi:hypothetical protein